MYGLDYIGSQKIFSDHEEISEMDNVKVPKRSFLSRFKRKPKQKEPEYILPPSKRIRGAVGGIAGGMLTGHAYDSTMRSRSTPWLTKMSLRSIGKKQFVRSGVVGGQSLGDN